MTGVIPRGYGIVREILARVCVRVYSLPMSKTNNATLTYFRDGTLTTVKIPATATLTNGPLIPLWNDYDAQGRPSNMAQDSWGRPVR